MAGSSCIDLSLPVGHNPAVPFRKPLAALLLLAAAAMPQLLGAEAHALGHHEHGEEAAARHAEALVHGHEHGEETPSHEHYLRSSLPLRLDTPQDLQAPAVLPLAAPEPAALLNAGSWPGETRLSGPSPPRLHIL